MKRELLIEELEFCLERWEKEGCCDLEGDRKECSECGSPYLTYKMLTGKDINREISLKQWKEKLKELKE